MTRLGAGVDGRALESELTASVVDMARLRGWKVAHHPDSRRMLGDRGLPDLICVRRDRIVFVELKRDKDGRVSAEQAAWKAALELAGVQVVTAFLPSEWSLLDGVLW